MINVEVPLFFPISILKFPRKVSKVQNKMVSWDIPSTEIYGRFIFAKPFTVTGSTVLKFYGKRPIPFFSLPPLPTLFPHGAHFGFTSKK